MVTNSVGRRMIKAKPTATTMKTSATRRPTSKAPSKEKMITVIVMMTNKPIGMPLRVICEKMKDWIPQRCQFILIYVCSPFEDKEYALGSRSGRAPTASMGFSVANLDSLAHSSLRVSGGKMRSRKFWP